MIKQINVKIGIWKLEIKFGNWNFEKLLKDRILKINKQNNNNNEK